MVNAQIQTQTKFLEEVAEKINLTGVGIISPWGESLEQVKSCVDKGILPESLIEEIQYDDIKGIKIKDFDYKKYLGPRGFRFWDRSALLMGCAVKQAVDQSKVLEKYQPDEIGLVVASDAAVQSQIQFGKDVFTDPVFDPNPQMFPNVLTNPVAGQIAMKFDLQGENITLSDDQDALKHALRYASQKIDRGIQKAFVVACGEATTLEYLHRHKYLKPSSKEFKEFGISLVLEKNLKFESISCRDLEILRDL